MTHNLVVAVSATLQLAALLLAMRFVRVSGLRTPWTALALAMALMAVRRLMTLSNALQGSPPSPGALAPELVALTISLLLLVGVLKLGPLGQKIQQAVAMGDGIGRALENSLNEIYVFDADGLRFFTANRGARENLGYTLDELVLLTPLDLRPQIDERQFRDFLGPLERHEVERVGFNTLHQRKDGTRYPVEVDVQRADYGGRPAYLAVIVDVTERILAEQQLRESEAHFRSVIENAQDLITVVDRQGTIVYQSPAVTRILGYTVEERMGRSGFELIHPEDRGVALEGLQRLFADPESGADSVIYRLRHRDGGWRTVEAFGSLRALPGSEPEAVINQRDVTERERARAESTRMEARLRRTQRLETVGTLAGGIAHDFNNLLTPILGYAQLLAVRLPKSDPSLHEVHEIAKAAGHAQSLVKQILAFSRRTEPERTIVELREVVEEVIKLARSTLPANIEIVGELEPGPSRVFADHSQILQVLLNLCTNAQHAMEATGGRLTLHMSTVLHAGVQGSGPPDVPRGSYVCVSVTDTGSGIAPEVRERVFEPFFTTKDVGRGTGLGLSVAHGIVTEHDGALTVKSRPGQGTTFFVWIPTASEEVEGAPLPPDSTPGGTERILLVDDEEPVGQLLEKWLASLGYRVDRFLSVHDALDTFRADPKRFALVMTDQTMPGLTGIQLTAEIRRLAPRIPVALMTGHSDALTPESLERVAVATVLSKPFDLHQMARDVRCILDRQAVLADS